MFGISAFSQSPFSALGESAAVSAALTGVSATGGVGSVTATTTVALTGVSATGNVGSVTETNNPTENGTVATGKDRKSVV